MTILCEESKILLCDQNLSCSEIHLKYMCGDPPYQFIICIMVYINWHHILPQIYLHVCYCMCMDKCRFLKELFATKWVIAYYGGGWMVGECDCAREEAFFLPHFTLSPKGKLTLCLLCSSLVIQPSWGKNNRSRLTTQCTL